MPVYLGNTEISEYINNSQVDIANPIQYLGPPQFFNVRKCGTSDPTTQLAIYYSNLELLVGYAVRPILIPGSTIPLPGYEDGCYELISVATDGIQCSTRAPAVDCSQSVCIAPTCTTYTVYNSNLSLGGQVSYVPCGETGYRSQFVGQGETISLCVENDQIVNVSGFASSSLTDTNTTCTATLVDCISYTVTNSAGVTRDYSGVDCSNCASSFYNINAGASVVRCFVSGTFATDYPSDVTATAGATCNVSGSGCQIPL
jgi:hypothetical protein